MGSAFCSELLPLNGHSQTSYTDGEPFSFALSTWTENVFTGAPAVPGRHPDPGKMRAGSLRWTPDPGEMKAGFPSGLQEHSTVLQGSASRFLIQRCQTEPAPTPE
jgi:hypothetical protein